MRLPSPALRTPAALPCLAFLLMALLLMALLLPTASPAFAGQVQTWTDDQGVLHLSDKPAPKSIKSDKPESAAAAQHKADKKLPPGKGAVFMWKASAKNNFVYLMGSMHYATSDFYPLDPRIEAAFDQCEILAVENDVEGQQGQIQALAMKMGIYPDGDSLDRHIKPRTKELLEKLGAWNPMLLRFKPWLLAMQLQGQKFLEHGYDPANGLDRHFLLQARKRNMPVKELENAAETLQIFVDISSKDPDSFLYYSLQELDRINEVAPKLGRLWKTGDAPGMQELIFYELGRKPEFKELGVKLFDERNVKMADKVAGYLQGSRPVFVVVGAGHLVGPMGIPSLLEKKGYELEQIGAQ